MRAIKYIGKALLTVILPVAFCVVSTVIITALFSSIGALMGNSTFQECFQAGLDYTIVIMVFVTLVGTIMYFATEEGQ
jgi:hypothetical protein